MPLNAFLACLESPSFLRSFQAAAAPKAKPAAADTAAAAAPADKSKAAAAGWESGVGRKTVADARFAGEDEGSFLNVVSTVRFWLLAVFKAPRLD